MRRLVSANFSRLLINRTFWLAVVFMAGLEAVCCISLLKRQPIPPMEYVLFLSLQCISIVIAIFFSLFLGTEYSDGTIRNKIIAGHKRSSIYLASLVNGIIAITIIYLAELVVGTILGFLLYSAPHNPLTQILLSALVGWLACVSFISIFNLIGMISASKAVTAITCLLTAFGLLFLGLYTFQLLSKPDYLVGVKRTVYHVLFEINPFGQILQTMTYNIEEPWRLIAYALMMSLVFGGLGLYFFSKKDLK